MCVKDAFVPARFWCAVHTFELISIFLLTTVHVLANVWLNFISNIYYILGQEVRVVAVCFIVLARSRRLISCRAQLFGLIDDFHVWQRVLKPIC